MDWWPRPTPNFNLRTENSIHGTHMLRYQSRRRDNVAAEPIRIHAFCRVPALAVWLRCQDSRRFRDILIQRPVNPLGRDGEGAEVVD